MEALTILNTVYKIFTRLIANFVEYCASVKKSHDIIYIYNIICDLSANE